MTTHPTETTTARALRPPRAGRSNGQWAVDGRDPLNPNEAVEAGGRRPQRPRADRAGLLPGGLRLDPRRRTSAAASAGGACTPSASRASTAAAPPSSTTPSCPTSTSCSGSASTAAPSPCASCACSPTSRTEFARGTADISDRQNIQYHWIRVEDVPEIWRRLEAVGLQTTEACGDTPRVILGSPLAGIAADEIIDPTPVDRRDHPALHRRPRAGQPPPQVQVRDHRPPEPRRRPRDQRHLPRRRRAPRARRRLRPLGRRRALDGAAPRRAARRVRRPGAAPPTCGTASSRSSATTATAGCAPRRA